MFRFIMFPLGSAAFRRRMPSACLSSRWKPNCAGWKGLKEITAIASEGHAGIVLEFQIGSDKDKVLADIRDKVDLAKADLPADADEPAVFETNFALQPTIIVTLSGDVPERTLYNLARKLKDEIESVIDRPRSQSKGYAG